MGTAPPAFDQIDGTALADLFRTLPVAPKTAAPADHEPNEAGDDQQQQEFASADHGALEAVAGVHLALAGDIQDRARHLAGCRIRAAEQAQATAPAAGRLHHL